MIEKSLSSKEILTKLINAKNSKKEGFIPYAADQLFFRDLTPEPTQGETAVSVLVSTEDSHDSRDGVRVFYRRVSITSLLPSDGVIPKPAELTDFHALIPIINETFGIHLTPDDVENYEITDELYKEVLETRQGRLPVLCKPSALVLRGATSVAFC